MTPLLVAASLESLDLQPLLLLLVPVMQALLAWVGHLQPGLL